MIQEGKSDFKLQLKNRICDWSVTSVLFVKRVSAINNEIFVDPILKQFVRASTSVGANYVEAIASPTIKDFRNFLANSLKSCNEAIYWLELTEKVKIRDASDVTDLLDEARQISKILGKSVSTLYKKY